MNGLSPPLLPNEPFQIAPLADASDGSVGRRAFLFHSQQNPGMRGGGSLVARSTTLVEWIVGDRAANDGRVFLPHQGGMAMVRVRGGIRSMMGGLVLWACLAGVVLAQQVAPSASGTRQADNPEARPEVIMTRALRSNPLTAPYAIGAVWRDGTVILRGRVGTKQVHDAAVQMAIAFGFRFRDDLVIDTAETFRVAMSATPSTTGYARPGAEPIELVLRLPRAALRLARRSLLRHAAAGGQLRPLVGTFARDGDGRRRRRWTDARGSPWVLRRGRRRTEASRRQPRIRPSLRTRASPRPPRPGPRDR